MKKILKVLSIVIALVAVIGIGSVHATPMLPSLDYTGNYAQDCIICDSTVMQVNYLMGFTQLHAVDPIIGATVRFNFNDVTLDTDDTFSIFDTSGTYLDADINWSIGSVQNFGMLKLVNANLNANLSNVVVNATLGSQYIDELIPELAGNGNVAATYVMMLDLGMSYNVQGKMVPTPEPATLMLLGMGLAGIGFYTRRRKNK